MSGKNWTEGGGGAVGQTLPLVVIFMMSLLLAAGLSIDIGNAYRVKQSLQASADAASAAGAGNLPSPGAAISAATSFGSEPGGKNPIPGSGPVSLQATANCVTSTKFCNPANTVQVTESATVPTYFLHLVGIDHVTVTVHSQACSPCGALPLDIMMVLDRTGSMDGTDMQNAKDGALAFLKGLDPALDNVGLAVLPPASSMANRCAPSSEANYDLTNAAYLLVPLSNDYANSIGNLNGSSGLVSTINCLQTGGHTAYAKAIDVADQELVANGRPGVQKVIIFESDGAANTAPGYLAPTDRYRTNPCRTAIDNAASYKAAGVLMYAIGYDIGGSGADPCFEDKGAAIPGTSPTAYAQSNSSNAEQPMIQSWQAMPQIASPGNYYAQPNPASLVGIFDAISADLMVGHSRING
jgi:putative Flp pilus-assembly TadE/G-like protein